MYEHIKKIWKELPGNYKKYVMYIIIATGIMIVTQLVQISSNKQITQQDLLRPNLDENSRTLNIEIVDNKGRKIEEGALEIKPKEYSLEDVQAGFDDVYNKLKKEILLDNESLNKVTGNLNLPHVCEGYPFELSWMSSDCEVIDCDGYVNTEKLETDSRKVTLTVWIRYKDIQAAYDIDLLVIKDEKLLKNENSDYYIDTDSSNKSISIIDEVNRYINSSESLTNKNAQLPQEINGQKIYYQKKSDYTNIAVFSLLGTAAIGAVIAGNKKRCEKKIEERKKRLSYDYSEMVTKLTLLVGAGMTMRKAWERIVEDYQKTKHTSKIRKCVYEEMEESYNQLKAGMSEGFVYENFGMRCNTKEYLKFSSMLVSSMKKGSSDLLRLLELEVIDAYENRKNLAIKYGEQAGTKLLFPMIVMLAIVMAVIMMPAMMSFSG